MSDHRLNMAEIHLLCNKYYENQLNELELDRLNLLICTYPEVRRFFFEFMTVVSALENRSEASASADDSIYSELTSGDLLELLRLEQSVPLQLVEAPDEEVLHIKHAVQDSGQNGRESSYLQATHYIFHTFIELTSKKVLIVVAAAILLFACILLIPWSQKDAPVSAGIAVSEPLQDIEVATVSNSRNAQWRGKPLAVGDRLISGQRLVLTEGFAEITTDRGAIATLKAPCTIELTTSNHTLWLESGQLLGRCPTPRSRGFVVNTPSARIVDIGTKFGVSVEDTGETHIQVFTGEVQVSPRVGHNHFGESLSLYAKQAVAIESSSGKIIQTDFDEKIFGQSIVVPLDLADIVSGGNGTGQQSGIGIDLSTGQVLTSQDIANLESDHWNHRTGRVIQPVNTSDFIDSVFIIDRLTGRAKITSRGDEFNEFPTAADHINASDAFGFIHATPPNFVINPRSQPDFEKPFTAVNRPDLDGRYLVIHGGAGITFDLQALEREHDDSRLERFTAFALNIEEQSRAINPAPNPATADVWVFVDGDARFIRRSINTNDGPIQIDVPLKEGDRFLTIAVSHGGDGGFHDWIVFSRPAIQSSYHAWGVSE